MKRKFAANYIINTDGKPLRQYVVEIADGCVASLYPMDGEMQNVEWMLGAIEIRKEVEGIVAYHLFPYDFSAMSSVDGTQRTLLR